MPANIEELQNDKKIEKLKKKQEKDFESLRQKHSKELDRLKKKQTKRMAELEMVNTNSKSQSLLERASQLGMLRRSTTDVDDGKKPKCQTAKDTKTLSKEAADELAKWKGISRKFDSSTSLCFLIINRFAEDEHEKELKSACSLHWKEEKNLLEDQEGQIRDNLISLLDQIEKKNLTTLELIYKRECQEVMKKTLDERKTEISRLEKGTTSPDDITRQREEIKHRSVSTTIEQRKKMANSKEKRHEEISTACDELKTRIEAAHDKNMSKIGSEYNDKIKKGDLPVEVTSL